MNRPWFVLGLVAIWNSSSCWRSGIEDIVHAQCLGHDLVVDVWQTLDLTTLDATALAASAHTAQGTWTVNDPAGKLAVSPAAEKPSLSCFDSEIDEGKTGLAYSRVDGAVASIGYQFGAPCLTCSIGFWWFYTGVASTATDFLVVATAASGVAWYLELWPGATDSLTIGAAGVSPGVVVSPGTWYWLAIQFNNGTTDDLDVFDDVGNLVGSTSCMDTGKGGTFAVAFGSMLPFGGSSLSDSEGVSLFDDIVLDLTGGRYPLGP